MDENKNEQEAPATDSLDESQIRYLQERLAAEQNLGLGIAAGAVASLAGAGAWAVVTVLSGYQIGFMAIGIGFLVGYAIRIAGKGLTNAFGVAGALFSLLGCAVGNLLAVTAMAAQVEEIPFMTVLPQLNAEIAIELMTLSFSPIDLVFYGIALYYGFHLSVRRIDGAELEAMLAGQKPA